MNVVLACSVALLCPSFEKQSVLPQLKSVLSLNVKLPNITSITGPVLLADRLSLDGDNWLSPDEILQGSTSTDESTWLSFANFYRKIARRYVSFQLYTRNHKDKPETLIYDDNNFHDFDENKPTKFITHGFLNTGLTAMGEALKDAILEGFDYNVIVVDWGCIACNPIYPFTANKTTYVGEFVGDFLVYLVKNHPGALRDVHLIGHSLGAHVSGFAARRAKQSNYIIPRVTGLDPADPSVKGGISKDDAAFVDIIHSDGGFYGREGVMGHVDFYPNNGVHPQGTCLTHMCSHSSSWQYYVKSLKDPKKYLGYKDGATLSIFGRNLAETEYMGEPTQNTTRGVYYLSTKSFQFI